MLLKSGFLRGLSRNPRIGAKTLNKRDISSTSFNGKAMIAIDTETTGTDFYHGTQPFFVSTCTDEGTVATWEWDVDPLTRKVLVPEKDIEGLADYVFLSGPAGPLNDNLDGDPCDGGGLVLQNPKFDFAALATVGLWDHVDVDTAWLAVRDTLLAAHLLHSNQPKNLTALAIRWLGINPEGYETELEAAVKACRTAVRKEFPEWAIAKEGRPDMPSAGEETWRADYWLPRAYAKHTGLPKDHPYWTVLSNYAEKDAELTAMIWQEMRQEIKRRKLNRIYAERLKVLAPAWHMERRGVHLNADRLDSLSQEYAASSEKAKNVCTNIAAGYGYDLVMPKGGVNDSLRGFVFDVLDLERIKNPKGRTSAPTLDTKNALSHYERTLRQGSRELTFVKNLMAKRSQDTAITYMAGYKRYWRDAYAEPATTDPLPDSIDPRMGSINQVQDSRQRSDRKQDQVQHPRTGGENHRGSRERGPEETVWKVLHPSLNPTGTDTLRWSSKQPNEQNISKKENFNLRYVFGPLPGREWWSLDAKNIELRLPAYESGEEALIELFERPDDPPYYGSNHLVNFHAVYPDLWDAAVKEVGETKAGPYCKKKYESSWYKSAKNGWFAIQYGAVLKPNGWGTADMAFRKQGAHALLFSKLTKLSDLNRYWINYANKYGYVETIPDRSVDPDRGYPLLCTRTEQGRVLETVPLSYHVQGSAMWWTSIGMVRVSELFKEWARKTFDAYIVMQVHDELVVDLPKRADPRVNKKLSNLGRIREIQKLMAKCGEDFGIPTPTGAEYHPENWSEGYTF